MVILHFGPLLDGVMILIPDFGQFGGDFLADSFRVDIDLSFATGATGATGSDAADRPCRPPSTSRGARMTVVRQANSLKLIYHYISTSAYSCIHIQIY